MSPAANFYAVFPHNLMAALFGTVFVFAMCALALGVIRFWRDVSGGPSSMPAAFEATRNVLGLRYLGGGHGQGCNEADDRFTLARRRFHHLTFYGFLSCAASTSVATLYHYLFQWEAPYPLLSWPVALGTVGGISLFIGCAGLFWLTVKRDPNLGDIAQRRMDRGFIGLLLTAGTGLALLAWRDTQAMTLLLEVHLGVVLALFATLPYSKFAHGIYRSAALLKAAVEKRQALRIKLGADWMPAVDHRRMTDGPDFQERLRLRGRPIPSHP